MLFSVRSRYLFAIGLEECLVFAVDACEIHEGYPTPAILEQPRDLVLMLRGFHPVSRSVPGDFTYDPGPLWVVRTPHCPKASVWTVSRSLAVTNDIADCFLFLFLLRCFNSERSPLREAIAWGFPFGDPQFFPSMRVPEAYRSLARPSSALEPSYPPAGTVAS